MPDRNIRYNYFLVLVESYSLRVNAYPARSVTAESFAQPLSICSHILVQVLTLLLSQWTIPATTSPNWRTSVWNGLCESEMPYASCVVVQWFSRAASTNRFHCFGCLQNKPLTIQHNGAIFRHTRCRRCVKMWAIRCKRSHLCW